MRSVCRFGGEGEAHFDDLGVSLYWLEPGRPMSLYHHEAGQEDFLVLAGAGTLIVEGEERSLQAWDFVHCPPRTAHTIVAAADRPALILAVGARKENGSARYPIEPAAIKRSAGRPNESTSPQATYAMFGEPMPGPAPEIFSTPQGRPPGALIEPGIPPDR
jgi:uncharacterized cupin superfamily protein